MAGIYSGHEFFDLDVEAIMHPFFRDLVQKLGVQHYVEYNVEIGYMVTFPLKGAIYAIQFLSVPNKEESALLVSRSFVVETVFRGEPMISDSVIFFNEGYVTEGDFYRALVAIVASERELVQRVNGAIYREP